MVKYWKTGESVRAKVYQAPDGHYEMQMEGEKYPFPGYPRGALLYGKLSPLKHNIKNKIFNDCWAMLEDKVPNEQIVLHVKRNVLPAPAVKEVYRAMTVISDSPTVLKLRDTLCFILQEDDAYRFRFQWTMKFMKNIPIKFWIYALEMLEHAEVIGDMKERMRLLKRVIVLALEDKNIRDYFNKFMKELDYSKVKLSKADKYFFRAKYFKVDYPEYTY